tara:strand:+ start:214 stop:477 length:264 start_codon:yes stop_codon:yes gene_type:complete
MKTELELIRCQIDKLDDQLFDLILKRCVKSREAAQAKGEYSVDSERECEILKRICQRAEESGLDSDIFASVYREVLKLAQKYQSIND